MPSLGHGLLFLGVMLFVTGCSTIFLHFGQGRLHTLSLCCLIMGLLMLILGIFWIVKRKNSQLPFSNTQETRRVLFFRRNRLPESQPVSLPRTPSRSRRGTVEDCDYPPMEPSSFSPVTRGQPYSYSWELEPPPPYEEAIKATTSSTQLTRSYSDTLRPTEPLSGCHREISFEV